MPSNENPYAKTVFLGPLMRILMSKSFMSLSIHFRPSLRTKIPPLSRLSSYDITNPEKNHKKKTKATKLLARTRSGHRTALATTKTQPRPLGIRDQREAGNPRGPPTRPREPQQRPKLLGQIPTVTWHSLHRSYRIRNH